MAPAASSTIKAHLENMDLKVSDYDIILTGDLGKLGSEVLIDLMEHENIILGQNYSDCGCMIYDKTERVFMGGSGAGCSASVLNSYVLYKMKKGDFKRVLLVSTGALMSTTTSQQGDTIPSIAHAVELVYVDSNKSNANSNNDSKKVKSKLNKSNKIKSNKHKTTKSSKIEK